MDPFDLAKEWERVDNSAEAALGGGILSAIIEHAGSSFVRMVACDPSQTGDEVEFFVIGGSAEVGFVYLRCRVDEVVPKEDSKSCPPHGPDVLVEGRVTRCGKCGEVLSS